MTRVSMTWPEYQAAICRVDGEMVRLGARQADVLCALLLARPDRLLSASELIERVWPDDEPDYAPGIITIMIMKLRDQGIYIESQRTRGYRIPHEARGRPAKMRLAA